MIGYVQKFVLQKKFCTDLLDRGKLKYSIYIRVCVCVRLCVCITMYMHHHTGMICLGPDALVGEPSSQFLTAFPSTAVDDATALTVST